MFCGFKFANSHRTYDFVLAGYSQIRGTSFKVRVSRMHSRARHAQIKGHSRARVSLTIAGIGEVQTTDHVFVRARSTILKRLQNLSVILCILRAQNSAGKSAYDSHCA